MSLINFGERSSLANMEFIVKNERVDFPRQWEVRAIGESLLRIMMSFFRGMSFQVGKGYKVSFWKDF